MIAALALAAALAPAGAEPAAGVAMRGRRFAPAGLTVLAGTTVAWRNEDHEGHTVRGRDFDSGHVPGGGEFRHRFERPGRHEYVCTVHRTMRGSVDVVELGLTGPDGPVRAGARVMLEALAPAGVERVVLERPGEGPVAEAVAGPDGRARFEVVADRPARYRARAGGRTSAVLTVRVASTVIARAQDHGPVITVRAHVTPYRPGGRVVLERYVKERYDWRPVARRRWAGGAAGIAFALHTRRSPRLRVRVPAARGGWAESHSPGARPAPHRH